MKKWLGLSGNFLRRPLRDQWLILQAFVLLISARLMIDHVPFSRLTGYLGKHQTESPHEIAESHMREARRIAWVVHSVSRHTPLAGNCLSKALVAKYLLSRRGIASTLYLGVALKTRSELEAHAWLRCGPIYVTGEAGRRHFNTLGIFG
jgi:hypothetical protein